jgi:hypothetical protein
MAENVNAGKKCINNNTLKIFAEVKLAAVNFGLHQERV